MGDQTREFASLYSNAVRDLGLLAEEDTHAAFERARGPGLADAVNAALDAVTSVFETGTEGLKDWRKQRVQVLARITAMREALARSGVDAELRKKARELVALLGPRPSR